MRRSPVWRTPAVAHRTPARCTQKARHVRAD